MCLSRRSINDNMIHSLCTQRYRNRADVVLICNCSTGLLQREAEKGQEEVDK